MSDELSLMAFRRVVILAVDVVLEDLRRLIAVVFDATVVCNDDILVMLLLIDVCIFVKEVIVVSNEDCRDVMLLALTVDDSCNVFKELIVESTDDLKDTISVVLLVIFVCADVNEIDMVPISVWRVDKPLEANTTAFLRDVKFVTMFLIFKPMSMIFFRV